MNDTTVKETIFSILASRVHSKSRKTNFTSDHILSIIKGVKNLIKKESSLLRIEGSITIVGDIHGNLNDLLRIFERCGYPPKTKYLFLGDYVDRGPNSIEVIILLFCFKILYPEDFFLLRGNHECQSITTIYGFKNDCEKNFEKVVYKKFMKCFMHLSYAAVVNGAYFCVHGGISPYLRTLDDIDEIEKPLLSSDSLIANDLVWSDPNENVKGFQISSRGSGYFFNDKKLNNFLKENQLKKLIRSHEHCFDGYDFPLEKCITVFSNTDYCEMNNNAAVIRIKNENADFDDDSNSEDSFVCEDDPDLKIELFSPLNESQLSNRRVLIPDSLLIDMTEKIEMQKDCCDISHELFDQLINQPICVF